ncbi:MAG TPA: DUF1634 domain-containing protein [Methanomassiliicoccales archaeon]|nr:DUF1634 domain-containing protein [Methanomassiliicoccales archaeon]
MAGQERLCRVVHPILKWGMLLSMVLLISGLLLGLGAGAEMEGTLPLEKIPQGMIDLDPLAFVTLGLLMLIATPLTRVLGALCLFLGEKDWKFALISMVVLSAVVLAVFLGAV